MNLKTEFDEYRKACYGDQYISPGPMREIEQAFVAGVLLAYNQPAITKRAVVDINKQGRDRLIEMGSLSMEKLK